MIFSFVNELTDLCEKHQLAIVNRDEDGMAIVPYPLGENGAVLVDIYTISPLGLNEESCYDKPVYHKDGGINI